ncbi:cupin domain-containing protein [Corynebacterium sp. CCM 8862]|uniref:Cupin domain-containing protein n=2 Tax=Corynebacterium mendelii TaxID=2765362 RepID=A0A939DZM5_9CORY|nr:cupin domain-containing protein [Corynebacterium mendelii]
MTVIPVTDLVPDPKPGKPRPAVKRLFSGDRANLIAFNFCRGQCLPDHKAAHPITVQCLGGSLTFSCGDTTIDLAPGTVAHLPAYSLHRVDCPDSAPESGNILLLTMLTGEEQQ